MVVNILHSQSPITPLTNKMVGRKPYLCYPPNPKPNFSSPRKKINLITASSSSSFTSVTTSDRGNQKKTDHAGDEQIILPKHVAVIMDGHRTWARKRGMPIQYGHYVGYMVNLKPLIFSCSRHGVQVLTVYAFSYENWTRPKEEVKSTMSILESLIQYQVNDLIKSHNLRFSVVGEKSTLPKSLQSAIFSAEASSKDNKLGIHFVLAINYSGRHEITEAAKKLYRKIEEGTVRTEDVDGSVFGQHLQMSELTESPDPDLLIRTSGKLRLSNFMLWQLAYAEFYFCNKLFPDFGESDLVEALSSFQKRKRSYGGGDG